MSSPTPLIALATGRIAVGATVFARPTLLAKGMGVDPDRCVVLNPGVDVPSDWPGTRDDAVASDQQNSRT